MISAPLLTDEQRSVIIAWTKHHSDKLRAVMVFGSRHTGKRTEKENPDPIPDIDIAVSIEASDPEARQHCFKKWRNVWAEELGGRLGGLKVDLKCSDAVTQPYVPMYDWSHELLWSDPTRWSERDLYG